MFLWRRVRREADDNMVFDALVSGAEAAIGTFNVQHCSPEATKVTVVHQTRIRLAAAQGHLQCICHQLVLTTITR